MPAERFFQSLSATQVLLLNEYSNGWTPLIGLMSIEPSESPMPVGSKSIMATWMVSLLISTFMESVMLQPLSFVTSAANQ